jgi:hypothetical protein
LHINEKTNYLCSIFSIVSTAIFNNYFAKLFKNISDLEKNIKLCKVMKKQIICVHFFNSVSTAIFKNSFGKNYLNISALEKNIKLCIVMKKEIICVQFFQSCFHGNYFNNCFGKTIEIYFRFRIKYKSLHCNEKRN